MTRCLTPPVVPSQRSSPSRCASRYQLPDSHLRLGQKHKTDHGPPDGRPDLQGVWNFSTLTPMQRPAEHAGKQFLTDEEAAAFEQRVLENRDTDRRKEGVADVVDAYNQFWYDWGSRVIESKRTSLVIEPADGRIPALTPESQQRRRLRGARPRAPRQPRGAPLHRTMHVGVQHGATHGPQRIQQQHAALSGTRLRRHPERNGARCAHYPCGRPTASS